MQSNHHHASATRVKVYHGRSHTKKQPHNEASRLSVSLKKAIKQKRRVGQKHHSKIIYTHYTHLEKPPHPCEKRQSLKNQICSSDSNKQGSNLAGSISSPFGGGREGAGYF